VVYAIIRSIYTCTRCGRSGHVAADFYQLRSAHDDNSSDDDDTPPTPVRRQPPAIPINPLPVTDDDVTIAADSVEANDDKDHSDDTVASFIPRVSGVHRVHHTLTTFYNPDPSIHADTAEDANFALLTLLNEKNYALASLGALEYNTASSTYRGNRDAMSRKDKTKWWNSMYVKFENMHDKRVWRIVKRTDVPHGRCIIGNRWVYALKEDGTYRARTGGQGFSKVKSCSCG
jgi:hypothetical protein